MEFPTLYGNVSRGDKVKIWNIKVTYDEISNVATVLRSYGQQNGKQTESVKEITKGKNIGKKNETTVLQQACNEAKSLWKKQKECGYTESLKSLSQQELFLPMLAHDYTKRAKSIDLNNAYIQPKIDGVRLLVSYTSKISRTGKHIEVLQHLDDELQTIYKCIPENVLLDGELFTFDLPFEELSGCIRQSKNTDYTKIEKLKFFIFDCFSSHDDTWTFENRLTFLHSIFKKHKFKHLVLVQTERFNPNESTIEEIHQKYVCNGYEGIMLRNSNGKYKCNYRSADLQKYKTFVDDEYEIIDAKEATGNDAGTAIFVCKDKYSETTFAVRSRGSRALRTTYLTNKKEYIGKFLTVRYQNLSEYGIPRFPVGIAIRDYE